MLEFNPSDAKNAAASWRWAAGLTLLFVVLQIAAAAALHTLLRGQEIASDISEYRLYVENPSILLNPPPETKMIGGWVAAPLLPFLLALIYQPLRWLGANEFLAFRGTMLCWISVGLGFTLYEIFRRWGAPRTKREIVIAVAITFSPLMWLPSTVLAQDETVAAMWCGVCFVCWSRRGVWACAAAAALGVFIAKPFFLVYFGALWMAYPPQRKTITLAASVTLLLLLAFMFSRDGELRYLRHSVQSSMSGSLYSLDWLRNRTVSYEASQAHRSWAKSVSTWPTILGMAGYTLLALRVRFTLPSAIVGSYCVMYSFLVGMMPEYELWFWSWSSLILWLACRRGEWLLGSLLYLHSILGYAYKILYSCDHKNFYFTELKPTASWYDQHFGWDLWGVMVLLSIALFLNTLCLAILLWRKYPHFVEDPLPAAAL